MANLFEEFGGRSIEEENSFNEFGGKPSNYKPPGYSPENPIDAYPPDPDLPSPGGLRGFTASPSHAAREIRKKGFEVSENGSYDIAIKSKQDGKWYHLKPSGVDTSDLTNLGGEAITSVGMGAGATMGAVAGSPAGPAGSFSGGVLGAGAGAGGANSLRVWLGKKIYGFDPENAETVASNKREIIAGGIAQAATPLIRPIIAAGGSLLKAPLNVVNKISRAPEKAAVIAARNVVRQARGELGKEILASQAENATRKAAVEETIAQGGRIAGKVIPPIKPPIAETVSKEVIEEALKTDTGGKIKFITSLVDPVWGVKAKNLRYVPEFVQLLRKHFGDQIINNLGSESMAWRHLFIKRLSNEAEQGILDKKAIEFAKDVGKWMLGSEYAGALSAAEKNAMAKMATGIARGVDRGVAQGVIEKVISGRVPAELLSAKEAVKSAIAKYNIAAGELARPPSGLLEKSGAWIGEVFGPLKNSELIGKPLRTAGNIFRQTLRPASYMGGKVEQIAGIPISKIITKAKSAPVAIQAILNQIVQKSKIPSDTAPPDMFYGLLTIAARNIPALRQWLEQEFKGT